MQSVRIAITCGIQPEPRLMFAVFRLRHESVNQLFISLGGLVCEELMHLFARGWQTGEIEAEPSDERPLVSFLCGC